MLSPRAKRNIIDFVISAATLYALYRAGAGLWALLVFPYGLWNFYDGRTRHKLWRQL